MIVAFLDGLFSGAFAVSFREGIFKSYRISTRNNNKILEIYDSPNIFI